MVLSYSRYARGMAVINFRTDAASEAALAELTAAGASVSEAVRGALIDAVRLRRREQMRRDAEAALADPLDLAESRRVRQELDELRAW